MLSTHVSYAAFDGCDGSDLVRGRECVEIEDSSDRSEVDAGKDKAYTVPAAGLRKWLEGPYDLAKDALHLANILCTRHEVGRGCTTGRDIGGGVLQVSK